MHLRNLSAGLSSAALLLLAASSPAVASESTPPASNESSVARPNHSAHSTKPAADEPKKICRSIGQTNSRLQTKKICLTREQWRNAKYN
ncbi:MAG TPA: hypothetical protein VF759_08770 [Allosphingosinicella sp.]|jgi:hypothetical protein